MANRETTSPGVRVIYSVPASAPRVIFIPIVRLWFMVALLLLLLSWSAASAWLLFARYDLTLAHFLPSSIVTQSESTLAIPEADAPRAPAAVAIPEVEVIPPSVVESAAVEPISSAAYHPVSLPGGKVSPMIGTGIALDALYIKWTGATARLNFLVLNESRDLMSGRIVARAEFRTTAGAVLVVNSPEDLNIGTGEIHRIEADMGLSYSTRRQVAKSIALNAGSADLSLSALDLIFVDHSGVVQAVFRFP